MHIFVLIFPTTPHPLLPPPTDVPHANRSNVLKNRKTIFSRIL